MADPMDEVFSGIPRASDVFELVKTLEFDHPTAGAGGSEQASIRIRLFRSTADPRRFRCRLSRLESWTLRPTFADSADDGESDEEVDCGWDHMLAGDYLGFRAADAEEALAMVVGDLRSLLGVRRRGEG